MGGGVIRIVGTGGFVDNSPLVTVLGSVLGTRFSVLGSEKQKRQGLRETGLKPPLSPHVAATNEWNQDQRQWERWIVALLPNPTCYDTAVFSTNNAKHP